MEPKTEDPKAEIKIAPPVTPEKAPVPPAGEAVVKREENLKEIEMDNDTENRLISILEGRVAVQKRKLAIAIKQTNENDWILQGGNPYLEITGAEKIAPIFGVRVSDITFEKEKGRDEVGEYIRYWYYGTGEVAPNNVVLYTLNGLFGSAWTRDEFFAKRKDGSFKSISELDERDLRYKAYSDLMRVAVVRLLGLRSVSVEELKDAGIDVNKINNVQRGAEVSPEEKTKQEELLKIVKRMVGTDEKKVRAAVKELTFFTKNGKDFYKENATELTGPWLNSTLDKAKVKAQAFDRENGGAR